MDRTKNQQDHLISWIEKDGPIRFDVFMAWALYDPCFGYYHQAPGMSGADFITAPEMGSLFSDALIDLIDALNLRCKHLVELGPGTGQLMSKLAAKFKHQFEHYHFVEISESLKEIQLENNHFCSHILLDEIPENSLIIANEWLDAIPSRRVKRKDGKLLEAYVCLDNGQFSWQWQATTIELNQWPDTDGIYDVRDYRKTLQSLGSAIKDSVCLWFDYGYHANELMHLPHLGDSLRGFYQNTVESDVLKHIGHMDITADVNFSALAHQVADQGWLVSNYFKQSRWIIDFLAKHPDRKNNTWEVRQLTDPSEMGERVRCLIFTDPKLELKRLSFDECARL